MPKSNSIIEFFRPKTTFSLEEKIFYVIFWMAILSLLAAIPINFYIDFELIAWFCVGSIFVYVGIYYLAFKKNKFWQANIVFFAYTAILLSYFYFGGGGIQSRVPLYFVILGVLAPLLLPEQWHWKALFLVCGTLVLISILEYFYPELVTTYPGNRNFLFIDMTVTHVILTFTAFGIVWVVRKSYDDKNRNIEIKEKLIVQRNTILAEYSKDLERKNKELDMLNASKDRLFSIIAHDLRSPLSSSKSLVELACQGDYPLDSLKQLLPDMYQNLSYTLNLVDNLLYWAKSQLDNVEPAMKEINLNKFLVSTFENLQLIGQYKQIKLILDIQRTEGLIKICDEQMIMIMLRNLFSNAVKFSPVGGKVVVSTDWDKKFLKIQVRDEGEGISAENLEKIRNGILFSQKGTMNEKGTGLGLSLVQSLMRKCNGFLSLESIENQGTIATLHFPIAIVTNLGKGANAMEIN
ncbi:MAG: HAMP domain-containing sensor histidine kinase [Raineya sp.]|nr:HAMP domain-containing sensor histidine kinase [Raineya sp.]